MKKQVTLFYCDLCEQEFEEGALLKGKVVHNSSETRFEICEDDFQKLFGKIEPSPRMGRASRA